MVNEPDNLADGQTGDDQSGDHRPASHSKGITAYFGVAMVTGEKPLPLHILTDLMGHSSTATTKIYTWVIGGEKQKMVLRVWD